MISSGATRIPYTPWPNEGASMRGDRPTTRIRLLARAPNVTRLIVVGETAINENSAEYLRRLAATAGEWDRKHHDSSQGQRAAVSVSKPGATCARVFDRAARASREIILYSRMPCRTSYIIINSPTNEKITSGFCTGTTSLIVNRRFRRLEGGRQQWGWPFRRPPRSVPPLL
jgi:hypothetical protein